MKHHQTIFASGRAGWHCAAAFLASMLAISAQAALTDIATTPIVSTSAGLVKPNIMLLMDASGSMGRTHMPDEVETSTLITSIGYKAAQCNVLYYNPTVRYFLPKRADGTPFPAPVYTSAPYSGFGAYFPAPILNTVDLSLKFQAYDNSTLAVGLFHDAEQPAYYYTYAGPETPTYAAAPCTQVDTHATVATPGGGTWTRVEVNGLPAADQQNFAIWYSYYRTRLSLIKSAASLAFVPLNATKRVGFITVAPKNAKEDPAINPVRYLPVNDFNAAQKNLWFNKIFSQTAQGTSPAREGLARVGRYYGGQEDSINSGMPATGAADPVQYACQQNFAIMTTDGYWNGQDETPTGAGSYGGGLMLDGTHLVGQQDGDLGDPYSPRPFWDGTSADTKKVTNKLNTYTDNICNLAGRYRSTFQTQKEVDAVTKDTSRTSRRTIQYTMTESQDLAQTSQTTKLSQRTLQTTSQNVITTNTPTVIQYQIWKSMEQTTQFSEQYRLQASQTVAQTFQTRQVSTQTIRHDEQWTISTSQNVLKTTQYKLQQSHYMMGVQQVIEEQWQDASFDGENWIATDGACVVNCTRFEVMNPTPVDPLTCTMAYSVSADADHIKTTCTPGAATFPYQAVPSCAPTGISVGAQWAVKTCDLVIDTPPTAFDGTCDPASPFQDVAPPYTTYTCTTPGANNQTTPVAACPGPLPAYQAPDWIKTTCSQPPGPNNQPPTAVPECVVQSLTNPVTFVTTTCAKPIDTVPAPSPFCVSVDGNSLPFLKSTCTTTVLSNPPIASAACHPDPVGGPNFIVVTCPKVAAGLYSVVTPVQAATCIDGSTTGNPDYYETSCTNPGATNYSDFTPVGCGGLALGITVPVGDPWITYNCTRPVFSTALTDPSLCHADDGTVWPYLHTTCTTVPFGPPAAPVDPGTCAVGDHAGPGPGVVTHCVRIDLPPPDISICAAPPAPAPNDWIVTSCGGSLSYQSVLVCPLVLPANQSCAPSVFPAVYVAVCTPQVPVFENDFIRIDCAPPETLVNNVPVDPANCVPSAANAVPVITCTTNPVAPYFVATPVPAPCMGGTDPVTFVVTTCTHPAATNFPPTASAPCVEGGPNTDPVTFITTTCTKLDVTDFIQTSLCHDIVQAGSGPSVTCTTTPTLGTPDGSCVPNHVDALSPFDTTTACHTVPGPVANAPSCTPGPGPGVGDFTTCTEVPVDINVPDPACVAVVDSTDPSGLRTHCSSLFGVGHLYTIQETDTVTTTRYSGVVQTGPDVVVANTFASANVDGVCYSDPQPLFTAGVPPGPQPPVTIAGCAAWPCTEWTHVAGGSTNSLADVSQYYYKTDLRPLMADVVPGAGTGPEDDNTPHQHMTTFVVGLGVSGVLNYKADYQSATTTSDFAAIRTGAKNWPLWPDPALDYTAGSPVFPAYNNPKSIDDYWHTAVNGRGRFFSAADPTSVIQGLGDALAKIDSVVASGSADSVSSLTPTPGDNSAYSTSYQSVLWQGDLEAKLIDLGTGAPGPAVWSAKTLLNTRTFAYCDNRKIFLIHNGNSLSNFTWNTDICPAGAPTGILATGLDATEQAFFGPLNISVLSQYPLMSDGTGSSVDQQTAAKAPGNLVNFLRGQRGFEGFQTNSLSKLWRTRETVLGDIVDSQPVYVKTPFASYQDANYNAFKSANAGRTPMVYVGANDGMLHAFYATLDITDPLHGQEAWAVIPSAVLPNLYQLADSSYGRAAGHLFFVDGTPVAADVADAGNNWKTILVGGLNAGGKGYYALDVTVPGAPPVPLWEFKQDPAVCPAIPAAAVGNTADCNLGFSFGKPVVTKLGGVWVVLVTSGYNNVNGVAGDGGGYLYALNALTGEIIYKIATGAGDAATPSGLAQVNNYVDNVVVDNTTLRAYGGDVLGNMWRFDFLPLPSATLLGSAKDIATNIQPITVRPELAELDGKPFVMFGTGRLLGSSDVTDVHVQSVYGLRDPLIGASPIYADPLRNSLRPLKVTETLNAVTPSDLTLATRTIGCTGDAVACGRAGGWVLDLAEAGERVNVEMKLILGALVFTSNVPEEIPCSVGGHSWFNQIDFRDGSLIPGSTFSQFLSDSLNVGFNVLQLPIAAGQNSPTYVGLTRQSTATNLERFVNPPQPPITGKRISWREVTQP